MNPIRALATFIANRHGASTVDPPGNTVACLHVEPCPGASVAVRSHTDIRIGFRPCDFDPHWNDPTAQAPAAYARWAAFEAEELAKLADLTHVSNSWSAAESMNWSTRWI